MNLKNINKSFVQNQKQFNNAISIEKNVNRLFNKDEDVIHENANKDSNVFNTRRD